jgi:hypothetical protein
MTTRTTVRLTDDIDGGSAATQTVTFSLGSAAYEMDLSDKNAAKLQKALAPYIAAARKVRKGRATPSASAPSQDIRAIRAWAREHGYQVSERGRLPRDLVEAYNAA